MTPAVSVRDYQAIARDRLDPLVWDYIDGGGGDERTLAEETRAFDDFWLCPRFLVDVSACDASTTVLGSELSLPIGVAPLAYHRLAHPDGEVATAAGAGGALMVVSIFASHSIEDIAAAATGPLWLQLYWLRRRDAVAGLVARAEAAGYRAIVLTVDAPRIGRRLRDMRNGYAMDPSIRAVNVPADVMSAAHQHSPGESAIAAHALATFDQSITWADLGWLRETTSLPIVIKGILTASDAVLAVQHGADAVIVSTHGGRQLDGALPGLHALPEVVDAVAGRCPVLFDGGVRRGTDVFTALALGARAVFIGRPVLWGLAAAGSAGVAEVLHLLREELVHTLALTGRPSLATIDRTAVRRWS